MRLDAMRLKFPLDLTLEGLSLEMDGGMYLAADTLRADVSLLPLLGGHAAITEASLAGAPIMLVGFTALSVEIITNFPTP